MQLSRPGHRRALRHGLIVACFLALPWGQHLMRAHPSADRPLSVSHGGAPMTLHPSVSVTCQPDRCALAHVSVASAPLLVQSDVAPISDDRVPEHPGQAPYSKSAPPSATPSPKTSVHSRPGPSPLNPQAHHTPTQSPTSIVLAAPTPTALPPLPKTGGGGGPTPTPGSEVAGVSIVNLEITVTGAGFAPRERVTIAFRDDNGVKRIGSAMTDLKGAFTGRAAVHFDNVTVNVLVAAGQHIKPIVVTAVGQASGAVGYVGFLYAQ